MRVKKHTKNGLHAVKSCTCRRTFYDCILRFNFIPPNSDTIFVIGIKMAHRYSPVLFTFMWCQSTCSGKLDGPHWCNCFTVAMTSVWEDEQRRSVKQEVSKTKKEKRGKGGGQIPTKLFPWQRLTL